MPTAMELRRGVIRGGVDVGYVPEWAPSPCRWHPCGFRVEGGKTQIRVPEMTVVGAERGTPPRVGYRSVIVKDRADGTLYLDEPGSLMLLDAPSRDSEDPDATPSAFVNAASWCFVARRNASLP